MKTSTKFLMILALFVVLGAAVPAQAESITLVLNGASQGTFGCSGANGCFGNDITLAVTGALTNWTVSYSINTTGNTNAGAGIGAVSFILNGFSYVNANVTLTAAPGGFATWSEAEGPANAGGGGCGDVSSNSICAFDTSAILSGINLNASPLNGPTYNWTWAITGQTFGGFDESTHVQALFGNPDASCSPKCLNGTGLISAVPTTAPEPTTVTLLGIGCGVAALVRRRMNS
jgi:hypothetical protein